MTASHPIFLAALALALPFCTSNETTRPEAAEILVQPRSATISAGRSVQLAAQVNDRHGAAIGGAPLRYSSASTELVRVSPEGEVTSLGPVGEARVDIASDALATTARVVVVAGTAARLVREGGDEQRAAPGARLPQALRVKAYDLWGNPVRDARVAFAAGPTRETATTDADAIASFAWTLGTAAGLQRASASLDGGPSLLFTATAVEETSPVPSAAPQPSAAPSPRRTGTMRPLR